MMTDQNIEDMDLGKRIEVMTKRIECTEFNQLSSTKKKRLRKKLHILLGKAKSSLATNVQSNLSRIIPLTTTTTTSTTTPKTPIQQSPIKAHYTHTPITIDSLDTVSTGPNERYYNQRFRLFSKFDQGIKLDKADRCVCGSVLDAFCGAGGNTIQFAAKCQHVVSVDIDPVKIELAKHNAGIYGYADRIDFINADFMLFAKSVAGIGHIDAIFLSPPWGGPTYLERTTVGLSDMFPDGFEIFEAALRISTNIAYFLPRNIDHMDLAKLTKMSKEAGGSDHCEVEENYLNGKLKTITVYFGNLIQQL
eukprot:gene13872-16362_t